MPRAPEPQVCCAYALPLAVSAARCLNPPDDRVQFVERAGGHGLVIRRRTDPRIARSAALARSQRACVRWTSAVRPYSREEVHEGARDWYVDRTLRYLDRLGAE